MFDLSAKAETVTQSWLLTLDEMILVNQLPQGIASEAEGIAWFERNNVDDQRAAMRGIT